MAEQLAQHQQAGVEALSNLYGGWVSALAWTTGDGPHLLFGAAVGWLRERLVLLPGATSLAAPDGRRARRGDGMMVSSVRGAAHRRAGGPGEQCDAPPGITLLVVSFVRAFR